MDANNQPLISIITITFNAAAVLPPTLLSVKNQSFKDSEHIIIDGASSDDTLILARKIGVEGIKILSEPDNGLYFAMNKGLNMAKGKYVIFLNAGDAFHSDKTLENYARLARDFDADIIFGDTNIVDQNRNFIKPRHYSAPFKLDKNSFSNGMLICHQSFMVKRAIAPLYDTAYRFSADYDWTIKCINRGNPDKFFNLNQVTIDYLSDGLTDKNHRASLIERFKIMKTHYGLPITLSKHAKFFFRAIKKKF